MSEVCGCSMIQNAPFQIMTNKSKMRRVTIVFPSRTHFSHVFPRGRSIDRPVEPLLKKTNEEPIGAFVFAPPSFTLSARLSAFKKSAFDRKLCVAGLSVMS